MDETQTLSVPPIPTNAQDFLVWQHPGAPTNGMNLGTATPPMSLQDWLAMSYLATGLGGAVGQYFRKGIPPPPVGVPQTSPPNPTTPTATQAALGMAQIRRSNRAGFGRG